MCSDEDGEIYQNWFNCVSDEDDCTSFCNSDDECIAITYEKAPVRCQENTFGCYIHSRDRDSSPIQTLQGPWQWNNGSNNFTFKAMEPYIREEHDNGNPSSTICTCHRRCEQPTVAPTGKTSKNMNFIFCKLKKLKKHELHFLQA